MRNRTLLYMLLSLNLFLASTCYSAALAVEEQVEGVALQQDSCQMLISQLQKHDKKLSRELRHIKREQALLRQSLEKPGFQDIVGGVGYILGLFGIAAYVASRKGKGKQ